jgi:DNA-binding transcriptional MerR regulator
MPAPTTVQPDTGAPEFAGVFSPRRAGALAGVSGDQIGQWARYGLIRPTVYKGRPANRYAFFDIAEAIVVHWLRDQHFHYSEIHHAIESARGEHPNWPLTRGQLGVARHSVESDLDRGVIVQRTPEGAYVEVGRAGRQVILKPELLDFAQDMLRTGGWIAYAHDLDRIEVDPTKLRGAPALGGSRWPIERIARIAADAEGRAILVREYGLVSMDAAGAGPLASHLSRVDNRGC